MLCVEYLLRRDPKWHVRFTAMWYTRMVLSFREPAFWSFFMILIIILFLCYNGYGDCMTKYLKNLLKIFLCLYLFMCLSIIYFYFFYRLSDNRAFKNQKLLGHGVYGIDNIDYTNSIEALNLAYDNDIKIIEIDFLFTSDNQLVLNHVWNYNYIKSYYDYMNDKLVDKYTPMSIDYLLNFMQSHKDVYVIVDTKEYDYSDNMLGIYDALVNKIKNFDSLLADRFIIQIYNYDHYYNIKNVGFFKNYIFTFYKMDNPEFYKVTYFCLFHNIDVIVIPKEYILNNVITKKDIDLIKSKNIKLYVHTVNSIEEYNKLLTFGINGVYTDFLNYKIIN